MSFCMTYIFFGNLVYSQELRQKSSSIKTGIGIGYNTGKDEQGLGLIYSVGWQKSLGKTNRIRINPNMIIGGFSTFGLMHHREQTFRITNLGLNIHYDLIKFGETSLVTTGGGFLNYSRGLLGTGGSSVLSYQESDYFYSLYFGGHASVGLRTNPKNSRLAYEFKPINAFYGNKQFTLIYMMFGIDFKLRK